MRKIETTEQRRRRFLSTNAYYQDTKQAEAQ